MITRTARLAAAIASGAAVAVLGSSAAFAGMPPISGTVNAQGSVQQLVGFTKPPIVIRFGGIATGATGRGITHATITAPPPRHSSGLPIALLGLGVCIVATLAAMAVKRRLRRQAGGGRRRERRERGAHRS